MSLRHPGYCAGGAHAKSGKSSMLRVASAGLCCLILGSAALAETGRQAKCGDADPDARIIACSRLLQAKHTARSNRIAALLGRAAAYLAKGDHDRAIADYERLLRLDPHSVSAFRGRAQAYLGKRELDKAMADLGKAIEIDPMSSQALIDRAGVHRVRGDLLAAREDLEAALRIDPNLSSAREELAAINRLIVTSARPAPAAAASPAPLADAPAPEGHMTPDRLLFATMGLTLIAFIGGAFRPRIIKVAHAAIAGDRAKDRDHAPETFASRQSPATQPVFEAEPCPKAGIAHNPPGDAVEILPKEPKAPGISADYFRALVESHELEEDRQRADDKRAALDARKQWIDELAERRLKDSNWRQILHDARTSAGQGATEFMLIRFPSQLCSDGGRAINAPDSNWPETLRGEPADMFARWLNELKPNGFQLAAQIIDFPDGVPGDAALFLIWGAARA
jgi:Flp pilus assembly protein TadD